MVTSDEAMKRRAGFAFMTLNLHGKLLGYATNRGVSRI